MDGSWTNAELYGPSADTLIASRQANARGARGAEARHLAGVTAAVFPHELVGR